MDESMKTCLMFALSEHRKLTDRFLVHINEEMEEQKKRTRYCFCFLCVMLFKQVLSTIMR